MRVVKVKRAANFFSETNTCPPRRSLGLDVLGLAARARDDVPQGT
jgi:hypothetical protein